MTPSATSNSALTVLDHLIKHLRARSVQIGGPERPAAILWTDPKAEWTPVIPTIQTRLDELLVLGGLGSRHAHGDRRSGSDVSSTGHSTSPHCPVTESPSFIFPVWRVKS